MKKRALLVVLSWLILSPIEVSAAPAYGTTMPEKDQAIWGLQHYEVFGRNLQDDQGSIKSRQNHLLLSYGLKEWLSLDLKLSLYSKFDHETIGGVETEYNNPVWGGGYGFRVRLYEGGPLKVVAGFQHISIHPKTVKANGSKTNGIFDDWQGSLLTGYKIGRFTPYGGISYASMDYIQRLNSRRNRIKSDSHRSVAGIIGTDFDLTDRVYLNLEGNLVDGGAASASVNVRF